VRDIEVEDLLGRDPVEVDLEEMSSYLNGQVILVTGAGGSIGSELCRQIMRFSPKRLLLLDNNENNLYEIEIELKNQYNEKLIYPIVASVQDSVRINEVFANFRPAIVFHAAAHKHVPLMELNPQEAVKNNIFGTKIVAEAADNYNCKRFVLISTDKAVNPTSVMGATKRIAEMIIQDLNRRSKTKYAAVRFGNVLGSNGSVIPLFKKQIAQGGPVTVTHPEMVRFFMTIPEAVQLVIQAGAMGGGGEIFVLDMGEPVKIVDLARELIKLSGLEPGEDIEIKFIGIRPGEKLYEEVLTAEEGTSATKHRRIFVAKSESVDEARLENALLLLSKLVSERSGSKVIKCMESIINTYKPNRINIINLFNEQEAAN
jgi:FlaA1/EpsC-like NDP-sugar epimerase